jgi:hypothetical protein
MMWDLESTKEFNIYIKQFKVLATVYIKLRPEDPLRIHYHFKKRKDMKMAMMWNSNPYDTFSYAGKEWGGKIPKLEDIKKLWEK